MKAVRALLSAGLVAASVGHALVAASPAPVARVVDALDLTGSVRADYFRSSKSLDDETDFLGLTAQLKALPTLSRSVDGKVEARFLSPPLGKHGEVDVRVLEGYLTWHAPKVEVRLGRQIVAWGRADGINPTDNLTPRDYVVLLPFEDDQRFGTTAAKIDYFVTREHTLTVFATSDFSPHRIPIPAAAGPVERTLPAHTWSNTEWGVRLNKVGEALDWSLSYYRGFSLLPTLSLESRGSGRVLAAHHDRIRVYGADLARNYGRFGFRGEVAYVDTADRNGRSANTLNPSLYFVVGVDRTFLANLNLNLQYFRRQVRSFHSTNTLANPDDRAVAFQTALLASQRDHVSDGASFRISNKWFHDTLEAEVFGIINFTTKDSFARPQVTYLISDHWKASVGYDWIRGAPDSPFGAQKANRGAFVETRYSF